ncbi:Xaa-Pro peptidase family protein [Clostridium sp. CF012]|uniref:M24 family metallopeptidase n=1 Tax=Clostridium sp. CF012 TaxID=2843319 RepID=UPI001C0A9C4D|nr:aminopeptidase P family protein [Clostridium sp. CF012]MBU3145208.1 aminopeptidase P family protein [Clostridium sp. CF012]
MYKERVSKLRALMNDKGIDAVLLVGDHNRNYLSGFTGNESFSLITKDKTFFITDSRFTEQANSQVKDYEILEYNKNFPFANFLGELIKDNNIKRLGFEEDVLSFSTYTLYKSKVQCEFVPMEKMVENIRTIKDESELKLIRRAAQITDETFEHMVKFIKPGMTEREIGLELEFHMKKLGAQELSFPSIIASGVRSSLPHGEATEKVVTKDEFLTLDFGCVYEGYCSDMTRTIVIGKPSEKMIEVYNTVFEAQELALKTFKPNMPAIEVDEVARNYIKEKGYGEYFRHGLGHGVGRQVHEAPSIGYGSREQLKSGMVVTDEPGIYIPGFGGVRIEDLLVITEDGIEVLSKSPKHLICID